MPKLYTKTGDKGTTSLYDGSRLFKGNIIFDVLGNLDELSSNIGMLCAKIGPIDEYFDPHIVYDKHGRRQSPNKKQIQKEKIDNLTHLREIQVKLLDIGSNIAVVDPKKKERVPKITENDVSNLEGLIDEYDSKNNKLTEFLLPGVTEKDAQCHICRSISRRVERSMWKLDESIAIDENILKYMNRLSDFFFAFSRNLSSDKDIKVGDIKKKLVNNIE